jgi:putative ABC transport system ATP-binding protein
MENLSFKQMAEVRKYNIGFVFQNFNLIEELSVYDNVALPLLYQNVSKSEARSRVENILTQLDIIHRKKHFPPQLSGGQQQRVAVARALVNKPNVILADEPTGNLDSKNGDDVMRLLQELNNNGTTIIMVTHSEHDAKYSRQVVRLMDGKVMESKNSKTVAI